MRSRDDFGFLLFYSGEWKMHFCTWTVGLSLFVANSVRSTDRTERLTSCLLEALLDEATNNVVDHTCKPIKS